MESQTSTETKAPTQPTATAPKSTPSTFDCDTVVRRLLVFLLVVPVGGVLIALSAAVAAITLGLIAGIPIYILIGFLLDLSSLFAFPAWLGSHISPERAHELVLSFCGTASLFSFYV